MTRSEASTALAKVFAYLACGKSGAASMAAQPLINWLQSVQRGDGV
jgi:hypothetical protein